MKRVFHHFEDWEDNKNGMYKLVCEDEPSVMLSCQHLLSTPQELENEMRTVKNNWANSAAINLTNRSRNRQAWLGQAACNHYCLAPEHVTKNAWRTLTDEQRIEANLVADKIIREFEEEYAKKVS